MRNLFALGIFRTIIYFQLRVQANYSVFRACANDFFSLKKKKTKIKHGNDLNGSGVRFKAVIPSLTHWNLCSADHYGACAHIGSVLIDLSDEKKNMPP